MAANEPRAHRRLRRWRDTEVYRRHVYYLSASRLISITGSFAAYVALVAVIYDRSNHSGAWVAAGLTVSMIVSALSGPWAGHLGDRFDRRQVMIASDLVGAGTFVGIAFVHSLVLLIVLAAIAAAAQSPFGPAAQAMLVTLVPEEQRTWATATRSASASAGVFLGGAIGGFLVAAFGGATAFLINAGSFLISAALVSAIKGRFHAADRPEGIADRGASEGFRFGLSMPVLWLTLTATTVGLLGTGMLNVAEYPLFVTIGGGSQAYGIAVAGWAVGQFIAGRTMRKQGDAYAERSRLLFGCGLVALAIGLCGLVPFFPIAVALLSVGGFAAQTRQIAATLIYQRATPDHVRARAFAALGTANLSAIGVAMIFGGIAMGTLTPAGVLVAAGFVGLLALIIALRVPPCRRNPGDTGTATAEAVQPGRSGLSLVTT
jgi:MFS family permease